MDAALRLQKQISKYLGTGPNATNIVFIDTGDAGRLKFDKNKQLGSGSGGTRVFLGTFRQHVTNEQELVAIKQVLYNSNEDYRKTFREVENLQQLIHPNVIRYLFADNVDAYNITLIALELCRGSLIDLFSKKHDVFKRPFVLKNREPCDSWQFKKNLLYGIADGLSYVHSRRYMHMDLKPQNVLVRDDDSNLYGYKAVLCDFELTRKMKDGKAKLSVSQEAVGTHGWMANELLRGSKKLAPVIDVFAYGCIVHYVLCESRTEQLIHPFGPDILRDNNILKAKRYSYISVNLKCNPFTEDSLNCPLGYNYLGDAILADMLVDACVSQTICLRPSAADILEHPFFWSYNERIRCTEQMFNKFKDSFQRKTSLISSMEKTWSSLNVKEYNFYIPEAWNYLLLYRASLKKKLINPKVDVTLFNSLMRLIRNLQQHYEEALALDPRLRSVLESGDDKTLGLYFFEKIPLSFPVIYIYSKFHNDTEGLENNIPSEVNKLHKLYLETLRSVKSAHPVL